MGLQQSMSMLYREQWEKRINTVPGARPSCDFLNQVKGGKLENKTAVD